MTKNKDFKQLVRGRMVKTGESYTAARRKLAAADARPVPAAHGRVAESSALARAFAQVGIVSPLTERPYSEPMLFGLGGGIGACYWLFEYKLPNGKLFTTLYVAGILNPYVQKRDFLEAAASRAGARVTVKTSTTPKAGEKQLREALAAASAVVATVDPVRLAYHGLPPEMCATSPRPMLVGQRDDLPFLLDLAPAEHTLGWPELATIRASVKSEKNRLILVDAPAKAPTKASLTAALREALAVTARGMREPPMKNFGLPAIEKWAELLTHRKDKKGWPTLFGKDDARLAQALRWTSFWVEAAPGNYRAIYADFLDEAAPILGARARDAAAAYRALAGDWTALARAALPDAVPELRRARELAEKRRRLLAERGPAAAAEMAKLTAEQAALPPPVLEHRAEILADLQARLVRIHDAERDAAELLAALD